ncbi:unnamed protein product [Linum tenue]|uniref:FRIGIDA-like protein n=1 Tax=Linum tenue TaxID=586396 RepID=A0AAV0H2A4_9ROSI|nr:unnamed protein product [Linum tenue]
MATSSAKENQIPTLKTIEAALNLTDAKKESLKKAYDELQSHSSLLSSSSSDAFSLSWSDLDSHFSTRQTDLTRRFHLLQSRGPDSGRQNCGPIEAEAGTASLPVQDPSSSFSNRPNLDDGALVPNDVKEPGSAMQVSPEVGVGGPSPARPELIPFCEKLDGKGLRDYISDHAKERIAIRAELASAMNVGSDPGSMVLNAMEGFYPAALASKGDKDPELYRLRKSCLDLLEVLVYVKPNISDEVRERAKQLALEWKGKVSLSGESPSEALAFLSLLAAYGLRDQFDVGELVVYVVVIAKFKQAITLCRDIGLGEKTAVIVQKLIDGGKQPLAVKFIFEFGLTDKFEAVPLLKAYLTECRKSTDQACNDGKIPAKTKNEAKSKEVSALNSVLQVIDEHKLQSEYPRTEIEKRIEMLQKQKTYGKQTTPSSATKPQQQQQQQQPKKKKQMQAKKQFQAKKQQHYQQHNGNKRPRTNGPTLPMGAPGSTVPTSYHQPHLQPTGLYRAAGAYGMVNASPPIPHYAGSYAGQYGAGVGFPGNPNPAAPSAAQQYPSESQIAPGYYGGGQAAAGYYDGYGGYPPQHHQTYYPQ